MATTIIGTFNEAARARVFEQGRLQRALGIIQNGRIRYRGKRGARVLGSSPIPYRVDGKGHCNCPDRARWCKHAIAWALLHRCMQDRSQMWEQATNQPRQASQPATTAPEGASIGA